MQSFEQLLGHVAEIMQGPCDRREKPFRDKSQTQISNEYFKLSLIWVACVLQLPSGNPMKSLPIAHFLVCTDRNLSGYLSAHEFVSIVGYFALPADITAMVSVKESMASVL